MAIILNDGMPNYISYVFYTLGICQNLLSVGQLAEEGYNLCFNKYNCVGSDIKKGVILKTKMSTSRLFSTHMNYEVTKKSVSSLPTIRVPDQIYEAGVLGKKHKEPFHTRQAWRAKILLELVHSDLCYVEVFDSPHLKVLVGKRVRKRLDVKSIIQLLQNVDAPIGSTVYIEQSIPYPQDGKQGWWSGGFGYGLWIGILVALGYSVIPVPSSLWKNEFKLTGYHSSKDDSRELASTLFPSMSSLLKRKKDHGRAEALLIAAYGKGLKVNFDATRILEDLMP